MDTILSALNAFRESNLFALWLPVFRVVFAAVLGLGCCVTIVLTSDDVLAALRRAVRRACLSDKEASAAMGVCQSLYSLRVHGERPLTVDAWVKLPPEVHQWFVVELATLVGIPRAVDVGARLDRRQASMSLRHSDKVGVA
jgi:hypothetical protein